MRRLTKSILAAALVGASVGTAVERAGATHPSLAGEVFVAAPLTGAEEVPPVETAALGAAVFRLSADGTRLNFGIIVGRIEAVTQAHIHLGVRGENGPIAAFLFGFVEASPSINGVLLKGVITDDDVLAPAGFEGTLAALVERMRSGGTYVNVHTAAHPAGEIRGQIRGIGHIELPNAQANADLNGNGVVDFGDITEVLSQWGQRPIDSDLLSVLENFGLQF